MGLFYSSIVVKGAEIQAVKQYFQTYPRHCFVSPEAQGVIVLFDKESEHHDLQVIDDFVASLSLTLDCAVMSCIVHDTSLFAYWLYSRGTLVDAYNEYPDYFEDVEEGPLAPEGGDAKQLCAIFGVPHAIPHVDALLHHGEDAEITGDDLHTALAAMLGLPSYAAGFGFYGIEDAKERNGAINGVDVSLFEEVSPRRL